MKFQLIDGLYNTREALELLGDLVRVKMAYLENRIHASLSEEDIKLVENRIKQLQREWSELQHQVRSSGESCKLESSVEIACS
jgi:hypothetical protein